MSLSYRGFLSATRCQRFTRLVLHTTLAIGTPLMVHAQRGSAPTGNLRAGDDGQGATRSPGAWPMAVSRSQAATQSLRIPRANRPVLDGVLGDDEWRNALVQRLAGGGEVRLQHDGTFLHVGIRGTRHGWSHVYLVVADTVFVHHASAALGTATYVRAGDRWQPRQEFAWELRDSTLTPQLEAARAAHLNTRGWVANNMNTGTPGILEFTIGRRFLQGDVVSLAVAFASDAATPQYWPDTLTDDCLRKELIFGSAPSDLRFAPATWAKVTLQG